ncbi:spc97 / Spc98 family of spindle pole body (SBP) component [Artemisia annua]|uniref:Gamma-tubulin complex component n=1 Tax=Artemisia annua TaxID=35608 RepID=A0A2U1NZ42_ARTAN|nr:spc97 / Spc98 family of spindle pole body (SBP) component [Artemisia annua]
MGIQNGSGTRAPQNPELDDDLIGKFCDLNKDGKYKYICEDKVKDALEEAPENDEITIKQAFVLIALHYIVCPAAGGRLGKNWLWYVLDVGSLNTQPWVTIAMKTLKEGIKNYQTGKGAERSIGGLEIDMVIGCYNASVQELILIHDLLSALIGIEGRYITINKVRGNEDSYSFHLDGRHNKFNLRVFRYISYRSFKLEPGTTMLEFRICFLICESWFEHVLCGLITFSSLAGSSLPFMALAKVMAGNYSVRSLLEKMIESANSAYLGILERWVYEGVIDDPHDEFFIAEDKSLQKESLTQDYDAMYWRQRYSLKDDIPSFLANSAETILTTGKYLNVMRECGHSVQVPSLENSKLMNFGSNDHYLECLKSAYDFASGELLNLMKDKHDLIGKLRSIKHYLLLDQGDFLVHVMDIARDELAKAPNEISVEKLQSLLNLALRSTAAAADPLHEDVTCSVDTCSLLKRLSTLKDLQTSEAVSQTDTFEESLSITGVETFSVNYKVQWPLSLVISKKALTKYQLIFRFLFHCKHVHRQLCAAWQGARARDRHGTAISTSSIFCRNMLKFINSLLHYLTFEVLEPNWHVMHNKLENAKSINEVIQCHDFFMEKCLKECLLLSPVLLMVGIILYS